VDVMSGLSVSLPVRLCSKRVGIPHAYGYGPCSPPLSGYGRSQNHRSGPTGHDSGAEDHPSIYHSGTWSPKLYDNSNCLSNGNSCGFHSSHKTKTFIETKVTAMKLQGFTL